MRAYWNSRYRPIACHMLSFRELQLVVDYLEGSLSVATWDDTAWIGGMASGTIYRSVVKHWCTVHWCISFICRFLLLLSLHKICSFFTFNVSFVPVSETVILPAWDAGHVRLTSCSLSDGARGRCLRASFMW